MLLARQFTLYRDSLAVVVWLDMLSFKALPHEKLEGCRSHVLADCTSGKAELHSVRLPPCTHHRRRSSGRGRR